MTRRRSLPTSRTSECDPRMVGMISASHASRRRTPGGSSVPSAVTPTPTASFRVWWSRVTRSRAGVAWVSGGRRVSRACWAVATRASQSRAPWSRGSATCVRGSPVPGSVPGLLAGSVSGRCGVGGGCGAGERHEGCFDQCSVLGGAAAGDPDPTGPVVGDREVSVQVRGSFLTLQGGLESAVHGVGVDDLDQMPAGFGELGGVQRRRVADHQPLAAASGPVLRRQVGHRTHHHVGLGG